jgi:hypothetical protein
MRILWLCSVLYILRPVCCIWPVVVMNPLPSACIHCDVLHVRRAVLVVGDILGSSYTVISPGFAARKTCKIRYNKSLSSYSRSFWNPLNLPHVGLLAAKPTIHTYKYISPAHVEPFPQPGFRSRCRSRESPLEIRAVMMSGATLSNVWPDGGEDGEDFSKGQFDAVRRSESQTARYCVVSLMSFFRVRSAAMFHIWSSV